MYLIEELQYPIQVEGYWPASRFAFLSDNCTAIVKFIDKLYSMKPEQFLMYKTLNQLLVNNGNQDQEEIVQNKEMDNDEQQQQQQQQQQLAKAQASLIKVPSTETYYSLDTVNSGITDFAYLCRACNKKFEWKANT